MLTLHQNLNLRYRILLSQQSVPYLDTKKYHTYQPLDGNNPQREFFETHFWSETKYGVDLAALTALHSGNEDEYLAARGGVEDFQSGADNPKSVALARAKEMFQGGEKQAAAEQAAREIEAFIEII